MMTNTAVKAVEPETADPTPRRAGRRRRPTMSVVASGLRKAFGEAEVIHGLDLVVEPGTILGLIGPSGCGKTTTVRLLTGLLAPTSGEATVGGTPAVQLTSAERARIGYLPQTPALFPDLSLVENLAFHASMYGLPLRRKARLDELLEWVELSEHRHKRVSDASGGMQRRLALAAAFVQDPDVVFLDEPTAGIDPILRDKFWQRFHDIAETGKTMVVTTQYVGEAGKCDYVGLLSDGELLLLDTPQNLRRAAFSGEVVDVVTDRPLTDDEMARVETHDYVVGSIERTGPRGVRVVVDDADRAMSDIAESFRSLGVEVTSIDEHVVDYDEAFVRVVERHRSSADDADEVDAGVDGDLEDGVGTEEDPTPEESVSPTTVGGER